MLDLAPTGSGYLGLMSLYGLCLASGFGLKWIARVFGKGGKGGTGSAGGTCKEAAPSGPGIARKFKVFFLFQSLMLTLAYWSLSGLGLFFLALIAFSAGEIAALQRRTAYPAGYGFRFVPSYGLLLCFAFSLVSCLVFAGRVLGTTFPPGGGLPFLAFVFLLLAVADGFAQITGQIVGGPKIVPRISPGKTWSGFLGGMAFSAAVSVLGIRLLFGFLDAPRAAALGALVGALAFLGDISASWVKRSMGLKDFSDLLGPQGGVLDRGDSLIWLGPALWLAWESGLAGFS